MKNVLKFLAISVVSFGLGTWFGQSSIGNKFIEVARTKINEFKDKTNKEEV